MRFSRGKDSTKRCALLLMALFALGVISQSRAQTSTTGAIVGTVKDPQSQVIPGAEITVTSIQTNANLRTRTNGDGQYSLRFLPVGEYKIGIAAPGFARFEQSPVAVRVTETVTIDPTLQIAGTTETVTVQGDADMVRRVSPVAGGVVGNQAILDLPLATRNYTQLMVLSPGISTSVPNATGDGLNSIELSAHGALAADNSTEVNGIDSMDMFLNTLGSIAIPAPDSLEEFKVQTALYSAATGRNGGANIAVVTKSGTNDFHVSAYEFLRNEALNANDFFLNRQGLDRPVLKQSQFGLTFGGPVRRDQVFFFGSYQGTRQRNGYAARSTLYLPTGLTSDRSRAALGAAFGGQRGFGILSPGGMGTAVANDGSNISPVAFALLNYKFPDGSLLIPSPQNPETGLSIFQDVNRFDENQLNISLDYQLSSRSRLSGKYFYSRQNSALPLFMDPGMANGIASLPGFSDRNLNRNHNLSIIHTQIFSPSLLNNLRIGYTRGSGDESQDQPVTAAEVGMKTPPQIKALPMTGVFGMFNLGSSPNNPRGHTSAIFSFADSLSYDRGIHTLQFGAEVKRYRTDGYQDFDKGAVTGFFDFPSFLLGQGAYENGTPFSHVFIVIAGEGSFERRYRVHDYAAFFEDNIRINPNLSVSAGLRWEFFGVPVDKDGRNSGFDFARALHEPPPEGTYSGFIVGRDTRGNIPPGISRTDNNTLRNRRNAANFMPRFGFAYQPFGNLKSLVLRGGYGIYYSRSASIQNWQQVGGLPFSRINFPNAFGSTRTFRDPLPTPLPASDFPLFELRFAESDVSIGSSQDPAMRDPYIQHFSLGIQYEFARNYLLEIGYVGSKGTHLIGEFSPNQPLLASPAHPIHGITENTMENATARAPYQGLSGAMFSSRFDSNYHSLQVALTKRFSRGFQFNTAYTYSKSLDNVIQYTSGIFMSIGSAGGDDSNLSLNKGPSEFDRRSRVVSSFTWQLPGWPRGAGFLNPLTNHWQVSGILTLQSGLPLTIQDSSAGSIFGAPNSLNRAQFTDGMGAAQAEKSGSVHGRLNGFFNTEAFTSAPAIGNGTAFGNSGRGILRGPDQRNLDLAVMRRFSLKVLGEENNLEFRAEAFNLTNTTNFGAPGTDRAAPSSFGIISTTSVNPRIIQFALKLSF